MLRCTSVCVCVCVRVRHDRVLILNAVYVGVCVCATNNWLVAACNSAAMPIIHRQYWLTNACEKLRDLLVCNTAGGYITCETVAHCIGNDCVMQLSV